MDLKQIYTYGCSFTQGFNLDNNPNNVTDPSMDAWPSHLSKLTNVPVTNRALGGNTNKNIATQIYKDLDTFESKDLILVAITTPIRLSIYNDWTEPFVYQSLFTERRSFSSSSAELRWRTDYFDANHMEWESVMAVSAILHILEPYNCRIINAITELDSFINLQRILVQSRKLINDISLFHRLRNRTNYADYLLPDGHLNSQGHQDSAEMIYGVLDETV